MRKFSLVIAGLAVMLGLSAPAFASNIIVFTNSPGPESWMPGMGGQVGAGIYTGTLNGTTMSFICDDVYNTVGTGSTWDVNVFSLSNVATKGNGWFAGSPYTASGAGLGGTVQQDYDMVAYLANMLLTHTIPASNSGEVNAVQWAIWDLMDHPANSENIPDPGGAGCSLSSTNNDCGQYWVEYAWNNGKGYSNPNIEIFTPVGDITSGPGTGNPGQEWIGETPEPLSMLLLGTFLSLAGGLIGRKKVRS